ASFVSISATALAYQNTLPQIWSGFPVVGDSSNSTDAAVNGILLPLVLILFTTLVNAFGVKLIARINRSGVLIELIAAVLLIVALALVAVNPPTVVLDTNGTESAYGGSYLTAFLVAGIASSYGVYAFDTAASLGEE